MGLFTNRKTDDVGGLHDGGEALSAFHSSEEPPPEPLPKRRLEDQHRAQAGNVQIDAAGLLEMLGVDRHSDLETISRAWQRFLAEHQPIDSDDADTAELKERIRREVNTAYASFRLTRAA